MALSVNFTSVCYTTVTLVGNDEQQLFRGFLIQARIVADDTTYAGIFGVVDSDNSQLSPCSRNTVSQLNLSAAINFSTALHGSVHVNTVESVTCSDGIGSILKCMRFLFNKTVRQC